MLQVSSTIKIVQDAEVLFANMILMPDLNKLSKSARTGTEKAVAALRSGIVLTTEALNEAISRCSGELWTLVSLK